METRPGSTDEIPTPPTAASLWAKLRRDGQEQIAAWHSLVDHSADVAAVVEALLAQPTIARRLATLAGRSELDETTCTRLAALAFLHDIGKANRGFRARVDPARPNVGHIGELAWLFSTDAAAKRLYARLVGVLGLDRVDSWLPEDGIGLFEAVFAHHGRPWELEHPPPSYAYWVRQGDSDPIEELTPVRAALDRWFPSAFADGPLLPSAPAFQHAFAGLLMLADWLGSDTQLFPLASGRCPDRMRFARRSASGALKQVGLAVEESRSRLRETPRDFVRAFGYPPRSLQAAVTVPGAHCVVLEAETGSGKTEAALWRFLQLFERGEVDGLYFALPTRVAATEMFNRVRAFRDKVFGPGGPPAVVRAVPGQIGFDDAEGHPLPDFTFEWSDDPEGGKRRARWAAEHPKRFLAAQIAVGTVDQALLGAIAVKHAHLRGTALLRHLLVVDEVHASDRYMEGLLEVLLHAHTEAGGHALLLSATLGGGMRARLLDTPEPDLRQAENTGYPALSWVEGGVERRRRIDKTGNGKSVALTPLPFIDQPLEIARRVLAVAEAGARVLLVRNTVGAAVAVAHALEELAGTDHRALFRVARTPTLHHGRFAPSDRRLLDREVQRQLGRDRTSGGLVVVGTQTLEQSLDLDADILFTDICPVDVLLQRIGRLHRHARPRPPGFAVARAEVLVPAERDLLPLTRRARHGLGRHVYDDLRIIEATWRLIEQHPSWHIPGMNRFLVERATHPEQLAALWIELAERDAGWRSHLQRVEGELRSQAQAAGFALLDRDQPFEKLRMETDERLQTRLGGKDRLVEFKPSAPGPFGNEVESLRIPFHFLGNANIDLDDGPEIAESGPGTFSFRVGGVRFRYDRFGLVAL